MAYLKYQWGERLLFYVMLLLLNGLNIFQCCFDKLRWHIDFRDCEERHLHDKMPNFCSALEISSAFSYYPRIFCTNMNNVVWSQ